MIKIPLKQKSYWEANQLVGVDEIFPGKTRMIQGLKELAPIIEAEVPEKKVNSLDYSLSLVEFFPKFLDLLKELRTPMRGFEIKYDKHYWVNIHCYFDYRSDTLYAMPLSFLPELRLKNKKLHDIICETVKLIKNKSVIVIDEYYEDDDWLIESMGEFCSVDTNKDSKEPNPDKELALREFDTFLKYKKKYVDKILEGWGDRDKLWKMIASYKAQTKIEKKILKWVETAIDASLEPNTLEDFDSYAVEAYAKEQDCAVEEAFDDGNPVSIHQCMRFTWFGCDAYTDMITASLGEYSGNFGQLEFSHAYECHSAEDIRNARKKFLKDWGLFPEKLTALLEAGNDLVPEIWDYIDNKLTVILDTDGI